MRQVLGLGLAVLCFLAAALSLPLPLPLGFVFFLAGVSFLLIASPTARRRFAAVRHRNPGLDARIRAVEKYLPEMARRALSGRQPPAGHA